MVTVRMELPGGQAAVLVCRKGMIDNTSQPTYPPLLQPQRINLIFPASVWVEVGEVQIGWRLISLVYVSSSLCSPIISPISQMWVLTPGPHHTEHLVVWERERDRAQVFLLASQLPGNGGAGAGGGGRTGFGVVFPSQICRRNPSASEVHLASEVGVIFM